MRISFWPFFLFFASVLWESAASVSRLRLREDPLSLRVECASPDVGASTPAGLRKPACVLGGRCKGDGCFLTSSRITSSAVLRFPFVFLPSFLMGNGAWKPEMDVSRVMGFVALSVSLFSGGSLSSFGFYTSVSTDKRARRVRAVIHRLQLHLFAFCVECATTSDFRWLRRPLRRGVKHER